MILLAAALAADPPALTAEETSEQGPSALPKEKLRWSGILLPLFGANSIDGPGFGFGGEVFGRPKSWTEGYRIKFTALGWATTSLNYTANFFQVDVRTDWHWIAQAGYRGWRNHSYAGAGGADVVLNRPEDEQGNRVLGPYAFIGGAHALGRSDRWSGFGQVYYKTYFVEPRPGGLLEQRLPFARDGGTYADATLGVEYDTTDRWPMPRDGVRAELSVRGGITAPRGSGEVGVMAGSYGEAIGWKSFGKHIVVAGRIVGEKTFGRRPFFDQDIAGGRWRDEIGSEQAFSGYGRTRSRGDGMFATMVEFRPYFFKINSKVFDFAFHGSLFAEDGILFRRGVPGPHLPTIGVGPQIVFKQAIQCRPFVAWGWRSETRGGRREPVPQFGVSFLDPL